MHFLGILHCTTLSSTKHYNPEFHFSVHLKQDQRTNTTALFVFLLSIWRGLDMKTPNPFLSESDIHIWQ